MIFKRCVIFFSIFWLFSINNVVDSAKILGIFPTSSKSHYAVGSALFKELAKRGHELTVISWFEEKDISKNYSYKTILLEKEARSPSNIFLQGKGINSYKMVLIMNKMGGNIVNNTLTNQKVKDLLNSNEKFDVVIMDQFVDDGLAYLANHFDAHRIVIFTGFSCPFTNDLVGNPGPPSVVSELLLPFSTNMNFWQRLQNSLFYLFNQFNKEFFFLPQQDEIVRNLFPNSKPLKDYLYNVSMVLLNSHESITDSMVLVPNIKNIGGIHLKPPGKLPKDLQDFLDEAKEGVVYFSMGSNLKSRDFPIHIRNSILRVFSKLKTKVLWKWEDEVLPGQTSNIKLKSWLPQAEILAHPNIKVFITHGGLLSTIEAVYHGVPLLTLPVYGDQKLNAATAVEKGYAINIPFHEFEEEKFESSLFELLQNSKYKESALLRKKIFHDRPMKPLDEAVYWVEYVLKHKGAKHLRVAANNLNWYQYLLLDVIAFVFGIAVVVLVVITYIIRKLLCNYNCDKKRKIKIKTK